jgi:hypothetical protein
LAAAKAEAKTTAAEDSAKAVAKAAANATTGSLTGETRRARGNRDEDEGGPEALREGRGRRKDRLARNLEVRDERSVRAVSAASPETAGEGKTDTHSQGGRETEITLDFRSQARTQAQVSAETGEKPVQQFQDLLARELHQNLNNDIVRHASILVRDGGEGTIKLSLRPQTLGNVKIHLEMAENKIAGHIVVESDEALKAFEQEIHSLEQAFRDSGFEGASLEISYEAGQNGQGAPWEGESPFFSERLAAVSYETTALDVNEGEELTFLGGSGAAQVRINMLA